MKTMPAIRESLFAVITILALAAPVAAQPNQEVPRCETEPAFGWLDFWLGEWDVYVGDTPAGANKIEKILDGCAITEHWTGSSGVHGYSLFYFMPAERIWKQVWVTERALGRGGLKEKKLIERRDDGALLFQGEIPLTDSTYYLDRTTLSPLDSGQVRQLIEISTDNGGSWRTIFDAVYRPRR